MRFISFFNSKDSKENLKGNKIRKPDSDDVKLHKAFLLIGGCNKSPLKKSLDKAHLTERYTSKNILSPLFVLHIDNLKDAKISRKYLLSSFMNKNLINYVRCQFSNFYKKTNSNIDSIQNKICTFLIKFFYDIAKINVKLPLTVSRIAAILLLEKMLDDADTECIDPKNILDGCIEKIMKSVDHDVSSAMKRLREGVLYSEQESVFETPEMKKLEEAIKMVEKWSQVEQSEDQLPLERPEVKEELSEEENDGNCSSGAAVSYAGPSLNVTVVTGKLSSSQKGELPWVPTVSQIQVHATADHTHGETDLSTVKLESGCSDENRLQIATVVDKHLEKVPKSSAKVECSPQKSASILPMMNSPEYRATNSGVVSRRNKKVPQIDLTEKSEVTSSAGIVVDNVVEESLVSTETTTGAQIVVDNGSVNEIPEINENFLAKTPHTTKRIVTVGSDTMENASTASDTREDQQTKPDVGEIQLQTDKIDVRVEKTDRIIEISEAIIETPNEAKEGEGKSASDVENCTADLLENTKESPEMEENGRKLDTNVEQPSLPEETSKVEEAITNHETAARNEQPNDTNECVQTTVKVLDSSEKSDVSEKSEQSESKPDKNPVVNDCEKKIAVLTEEVPKRKKLKTLGLTTGPTSIKSLAEGILQTRKVVVKKAIKKAPKNQDNDATNTTNVKEPDQEEGKIEAPEQPNAALEIPPKDEITQKEEPEYNLRKRASTQKQNNPEPPPKHPQHENDKDKTETDSESSLTDSSQKSDKRRHKRQKSLRKSTKERHGKKTAELWLAFVEKNRSPSKTKKTAHDRLQNLESTRQVTTKVGPEDGRSQKLVKNEEDVPPINASKNVESVPQKSMGVSRSKRENSLCEAGQTKRGARRISESDHTQRKKCISSLKSDELDVSTVNQHDPSSNASSKSPEIVVAQGNPVKQKEKLETTQSQRDKKQVKDVNKESEHPKESAEIVKTETVSSNSTDNKPKEKSKLSEKSEPKLRTRNDFKTFEEDNPKKPITPKENDIAFNSFSKKAKGKCKVQPTKRGDIQQTQRAAKDTKASAPTRVVSLRDWTKVTGRPIAKIGPQKAYVIPRLSNRVQPISANRKLTDDVKCEQVTPMLSELDDKCKVVHTTGMLSNSAEVEIKTVTTKINITIDDKLKRTNSLSEEKPPKTKSVSPKENFLSLCTEFSDFLTETDETKPPKRGKSKKPAPKTTNDNKPNVSVRTHEEQPQVTLTSKINPKNGFSDQHLFKPDVVTRIEKVFKKQQPEKFDDSGLNMLIEAVEISDSQAKPFFLQADDFQAVESAQPQTVYNHESFEHLKHVGGEDSCNSSDFPLVIDEKDANQAAKTSAEGPTESTKSAVSPKKAKGFVSKGARKHYDKPKQMRSKKQRKEKSTSPRVVKTKPVQKDRVDASISPTQKYVNDMETFLHDAKAKYLDEKEIGAEVIVDNIAVSQRNHGEDLKLPSDLEIFPVKTSRRKGVLESKEKRTVNETSTRRRQSPRSWRSPGSIADYQQYKLDDLEVIPLKTGAKARKNIGAVAQELPSRVNLRRWSSSSNSSRDESGGKKSKQNAKTEKRLPELEECSIKAPRYFQPSAEDSSEETHGNCDSDDDVLSVVRKRIRPKLKKQRNSNKSPARVGKKQRRKSSLGSENSDEQPKLTRIVDIPISRSTDKFVNEDEPPVLTPAVPLARKSPNNVLPYKKRDNSAFNNERQKATDNSLLDLREQIKQSNWPKRQPEIVKSGDTKISKAARLIDENKPKHLDPGNASETANNAEKTNEDYLKAVKGKVTVSKKSSVKHTVEPLTGTKNILPANDNQGIKETEQPRKDVVVEKEKNDKNEVIVINNKPKTILATEVTKQDETILKSKLNEAESKTKTKFSKEKLLKNGMNAINNETKSVEQPETGRSQENASEPRFIKEKVSKEKPVPNKTSDINNDIKLPVETKTTKVNENISPLNLNEERKTKTRRSKVRLNKNELINELLNEAKLNQQIEATITDEHNSEPQLIEAESQVETIVSKEMPVEDEVNVCNVGIKSATETEAAEDKEVFSKAKSNEGSETKTEVIREQLYKNEASVINDEITSIMEPGTSIANQSVNEADLRTATKRLNEEIVNNESAANKNDTTVISDLVEKHKNDEIKLKNVVAEVDNSSPVKENTRNETEQHVKAARSEDIVEKSTDSKTELSVPSVETVSKGADKLSVEIIATCGQVEPNKVITSKPITEGMCTQNETVENSVVSSGKKLIENIPDAQKNDKIADAQLNSPTLDKMQPKREIPKILATVCKKQRVVTKSLYKPFEEFVKDLNSPTDEKLPGEPEQKRKKTKNKEENVTNDSNEIMQDRVVETQMSVGKQTQPDCVSKESQTISSSDKEITQEALGSKSNFKTAPLLENSEEQMGGNLVETNDTQNSVDQTVCQLVPEVSKVEPIEKVVEEEPKTLEKKLEVPAPETKLTNAPTNDERIVKSDSILEYLSEEPINFVITPPKDNLQQSSGMQTRETEVVSGSKASSDASNIAEEGLDTSDANSEKNLKETCDKSSEKQNQLTNVEEGASSTPKQQDDECSKAEKQQKVGSEDSNKSNAELQKNEMVTFEAAPKEVVSKVVAEENVVTTIGKKSKPGTRLEGKKISEKKDKLTHASVDKTKNDKEMHTCKSVEPVAHTESTQIYPTGCIETTVTTVLEPRTVEETQIVEKIEEISLETLVQNAPLSNNLDVSKEITFCEDVPLCNDIADATNISNKELSTIPQSSFCEKVVPKPPTELQIVEENSNTTAPTEKPTSLTDSTVVDSRKRATKKRKPSTDNVYTFDNNNCDEELQEMQPYRPKHQKKSPATPTDFTVEKLVSERKEDAAYADVRTTPSPTLVPTPVTRAVDILAPVSATVGDVLPVIDASLLENQGFYSFTLINEDKPGEPPKRVSDVCMGASELDTQNETVSELSSLNADNKVSPSKETDPPSLGTTQGIEHALELSGIDLLVDTIENTNESEEKEPLPDFSPNPDVSNFKNVGSFETMSSMEMNKLFDQQDFFDKTVDFTEPSMTKVSHVHQMNGVCCINKRTAMHSVKEYRFVTDENTSKATHTDNSTQAYELERSLNETVKQILTVGKTNRSPCASDSVVESTGNVSKSTDTSVDQYMSAFSGATFGDYEYYYDFPAKVKVEYINQLDDGVDWTNTRVPQTADFDESSCLSDSSFSGAELGPQIKKVKLGPMIQNCTKVTESSVFDVGSNVSPRERTKSDSSRRPAVRVSQNLGMVDVSQRKSNRTNPAKYCKTPTRQPANKDEVATAINTCENVNLNVEPEKNKKPQVQKLPNKPEEVKGTLRINQLDSDVPADTVTKPKSKPQGSPSGSQFFRPFMTSTPECNDDTKARQTSSSKIKPSDQIPPKLHDSHSPASPKKPSPCTTNKPIEIPTAPAPSVAPPQTTPTTRSPRNSPSSSTKPLNIQPHTNPHHTSGHKLPAPTSTRPKTPSPLHSLPSISKTQDFQPVTNPHQYGHKPPTPTPTRSKTPSPLRTPATKPTDSQPSTNPHHKPRTPVPAPPKTPSPSHSPSPTGKSHSIPPVTNPYHNHHKPPTQNPTRPPTSAQPTSNNPHLTHNRKQSQPRKSSFVPNHRGAEGALPHQNHARTDSEQARMCRSRERPEYTSEKVPNYNGGSSHPKERPSYTSVPSSGGVKRGGQQHGDPAKRSRTEGEIPWRPKKLDDGITRSGYDSPSGAPSSSYTGRHYGRPAHGASNGHHRGHDGSGSSRTGRGSPHVHRCECDQCPGRTRKKHPDVCQCKRCPCPYRSKKDHQTNESSKQRNSWDDVARFNARLPERWKIPTNVSFGTTPTE